MNSFLNDQDLLLQNLIKIEDYRDFLNNVIDDKSQTCFKSKKDLATALGVTPAFVTKVISKKAHLSMGHAMSLGQAMNLNGLQASILIDKVLLSKTDEPELKRLLQARFDWSQNYVVSNHHENTQDKSLRPINTPTVFWRIKSCVLYQSKTIDQISQELDIGKVRLKYLLNEMQGSFLLKENKIDGKTYYESWLEPEKFKAVDPTSLQQVSVVEKVREMAARSYSDNYPVHLTDEKHKNHHLAEASILHITKAEALELKSLLSRIGHRAVEMSKDTKNIKDKKLIGLMIDLFDI